MPQRANEGRTGAHGPNASLWLVAARAIPRRENERMAYATQVRTDPDASPLIAIEPRLGQERRCYDARRPHDGIGHNPCPRLKA